MSTGCQGPYCHGTGGWCGCNCKCCPPPCCPHISVYFACGSPSNDCKDTPPPHAMANWNVKLKSLKETNLPDFDPTPIISDDGRFTFGSGNDPCPSIPCTTICVELSCGGMTPCCCLELLEGKIYAVGNGHVTAPESVPIPDPQGNCGDATVLINGKTPPVFVHDCDEIKVTISSDSCCPCDQIAVRCAPCPTSLASRKALFKRKVDQRTGKPKINPKTGKPIIYLDKAELKKRILSRINKLQRRRKN